MSLTHTIHPDSHTHGLADGCPRCDEHALNPLRTLDEANLRGLLHRVVTQEDARSENEAEAMHNIRQVLDQAGILAQLHPLAFCKYVGARWGIRIVPLDAD